jgi:hypothetical protein
MPLDFITRYEVTDSGGIRIALDKGQRSVEFALQALTEGGGDQSVRRCSHERSDARTNPPGLGCRRQARCGASGIEEKRLSAPR